jgi:hypothetical protein
MTGKKTKKTIKTREEICIYDRQDRNASPYLPVEGRKGGKAVRFPASAPRRTPLGHRVILEGRHDKGDY